MTDTTSAAKLSACDVVADIGGTNARFAIADGSGRFVREQTLKCNDFPSFADAYRHYCKSQSVQPLRAVIAIANPVLGDRIQMTNHHWAFSISETRAELGLSLFKVINDFEALALSLPDLAGADLQQIGGEAPVEGATKAVIGPGTGLGVASLLGADGQWFAVPGEGGHASYPARSEREWRMVAHLQSRFEGHVSAERLISGPGLSLMHSALQAIDGNAVMERSAADITLHALAGNDAYCVEAVGLFCEALGNVAGNLALTVGARGGVYIGGGVIPRLGVFFLHSGFRAAFDSKGRFRRYLAPIPVYVIHAACPAYLGAARSMRA